jgi:anaerobic selenocysteine-containing dehydrogenase
VPQGDDAGDGDRPAEAVASEADAASAAVREAAAPDAATAQANHADANQAQAAAVAADSTTTGPHGGHQATSGSGGRPPLIGFEAIAVAAPPAVDAYSLRLVATRKLYDLGTSVQRSPSLKGLAPGASVRLHPHDFDRVGVAAGTPVSVSSAKGSITLPVHSDDGVPRGSAAVLFSQPGADVSALIDATATITDVRVVP